MAENSIEFFKKYTERLDREKTKARIEEIKAAKIGRWLSRLGIEEQDK